MEIDFKIKVCNFDYFLEMNCDSHYAYIKYLYSVSRIFKAFALNFMH